MCVTCGCGQDEVRVSKVGDESSATHTHLDDHGRTTHSHPLMIDTAPDTSAQPTPILKH